MEELKKLLDAQAAAFEEFKKTNEARLAEIKANGAASGEFDAKLARINDTLAALADRIEAAEKKAVRPAAGDAKDPDAAEHKAAIFGPEGFMRKGETGRAFAECKAMRSGSDPDGGYTLPQETVGAISRIAEDQVAMYDLATVTPIGGGGWAEPVVTTGMTAGHTGETGTRSETTAPKLSKVTITAEESYVMPAIYNHLLEDSSLDLEAWLVGEAGYSFADLDDTDFITGTGVNSAHGIAGYTFVADASYAWGKVGYVVTGKSSAFYDTDPADVFIDVEAALKTKYHANAHYLMNRSTLGTIRKLKDGMGQYLWMPGLAAGVPNTINGYPYRISDNMATIGSSSYSIAFGDFRAAYRIVTRRGMTILRDPYTTKGLTYFYISKRLGGAIKNFEAVKFIKFSA